MLSVCFLCFAAVFVFSTVADNSNNNSPTLVHVNTHADLTFGLLACTNTSSPTVVYFAIHSQFTSIDLQSPFMITGTLPANITIACDQDTDFWRCDDFPCVYIATQSVTTVSIVNCSFQGGGITAMMTKGPLRLRNVTLDGQQKRYTAPLLTSQGGGGDVELDTVTIHDSRSGCVAVTDLSGLFTMKHSRIEHCGSSENGACVQLENKFSYSECEADNATSLFHAYMEHTTIRFCSANTAEGGSVFSKCLNTTVLRNVTITNGTSAFSGGCVHVEAVLDRVILEDVRVENCTILTARNHGGCVTARAKNRLLIRNMSLQNCIATMDGGCLRIQKSFAVEVQRLVLSQCYTYGMGAGLFVGTVSELALSDITTNNTYGTAQGSAVTLFVVFRTYIKRLWVWNAYNSDDSSCVYVWEHSYMIDIQGMFIMSCNRGIPPPALTPPPSPSLNTSYGALTIVFSARTVIRDSMVSNVEWNGMYVDTWNTTVTNVTVRNCARSGMVFLSTPPPLTTLVAILNSTNSTTKSTALELRQSYIDGPQCLRIIPPYESATIGSVVFGSCITGVPVSSPMTALFVNVSYLTSEANFTDKKEYAYTPSNVANETLAAVPVELRNALHVLEGIGTVLDPTSSFLSQELASTLTTRCIPTFSSGEDDDDSSNSVLSLSYFVSNGIPSNVWTLSGIAISHIIYVVIVLGHYQLKKQKQQTPPVSLHTSATALQYPKFCVRYHIVLLIPMLSSALLMQGVVSWICTVIAFIALLACHMITNQLYKPTYTAPEASNANATRFLLPRGEWKPSFAVTLTGPMFSRYHGVQRISPHIIFWISALHGCVATGVAQVHIEDSTTCGVLIGTVAVFGFFLGVYHVVADATTVTAVSWIRGLRYVLNSVIGFLILSLVGKPSKNDASVVLGNVLVGLTTTQLVCGYIELFIVGIGFVKNPVTGNLKPHRPKMMIMRCWKGVSWNQNRKSRLVHLWSCNRRWYVMREFLNV
eukprot:PhF_6_TR43162/c0_g1_i1/m.66105